MWVKTCSPGGCTTHWRTTTPWRRPVLTTSSPTSAGGRCSGADTTFMGLPLETIHITYSVVTLFVSDFLRPKPLDLCLTDIASPCHGGWSDGWKQRSAARTREAGLVSARSLSKTSPSDLETCDPLFHLPKLDEHKSWLYNELSQLQKLCVP